MSTAEEYQAKADEALAQLAEAKTDAERTRLKRAHGAYMRLVNHGADMAARAAQPRPPRIKSEKDAATAALQAGRPGGRGYNLL